MNDLYRISFVTDPDGRVLLADIDLVEPVAELDVNYDSGPFYVEGLGELPYGQYAIVRLEATDDLIEPQHRWDEPPEAAQG